MNEETRTDARELLESIAPRQQTTELIQLIAFYAKQLKGWKTEEPWDCDEMAACALRLRDLVNELLRYRKPLPSGLIK